MDVNRFLDEEGRVTVWPKKHQDKDAVCEYLSTKVELGVSYHENQVNEILKQWHTFHDWPLLRREMYERGYFSRTIDGTDYRKLVK